MAAGPDLPPIELIAVDGENVGVEPPAPDVKKNGDGARSRRRRNGLITVGVVVVVLLGVVILTRDTPSDPTLQEWAAEHHVGEPLSGISPPESVTCNIDPYDFMAVADCVRDANERGLPASGHFMLDSAYPDAIDVWLTFEEGGAATTVQRVVSAEPPPDQDGTSISPSSLKRLNTVWTARACESIEFLAEEDVFPGFACDDGWPGPMRTRAERSRSLTEEERADLVHRFACTFPDQYPDEEC